MTKQNKTILLLVIAALVWGYTGLKWFNYFSVEGSNDMLMQQSTSMIPDIILEEKKEYILNADYDDPFLKNVKYRNAVAKPINKNPVIQKPAPKVVVKPTYKWPNMVYSGLILAKGEKLGLLKISNQDVLAKKGDIHQQIMILGVYSDSINLGYEDYYKTVLKK